MKTKGLIQIVLGGTLALQVYPTWGADAPDAGITAESTTRFVMGDVVTIIQGNSSKPTWGLGGDVPSSLDNSQIYGAIEVARGGGIATGSAIVHLKSGEFAGHQSALVALTATSSVRFHLTNTLGYNYRLVTSLDVGGNVEGHVVFAGVFNNTTPGTFHAGAFLKPGDYVLEAGLNTGTKAFSGSGSFSYALALIPASVKGKYTEAEKKDLFLAGSSYRLFSQSLIIASRSGSLSCLACEQALLVTAQDVNRIATALIHISEDPLDPNYTALIQPAISVVTPLVAGGGVTQPAADAYNLWQTNLSLSAAYSAALATSVDRAQGAAYAGSPSWETAQMNAAVQFEAQLAALADQELALRSNVVAQFQAGGFPAITVTTNDVIALQTQIGTNGLPADLLNGLTALGVDPDTITNIQNTLLTADANKLSGGFPGSLANTNLDGTMQALAAAFRDASLTLINASVLPGGQFRFDLPTEPGYIYHIQFTENLAPPVSWTTLLTTNATSALLSFTNAPATGGGAGYYQASHDP